MLAKHSNSPRPALTAPRQRPEPPSLRAAEGGFTLVELLVSATIALTLLLGVAQLFSMFGSTGRQSQAIALLNAELRSVENRLRQDLEGCTAPTTPSLNPGDELGYFEILEGPKRDTPFDADGKVRLTPGEQLLAGDCDDALMFTTQSLGEPFRGWFRRYEDANGNSVLDVGEDVNGNATLDLEDILIEANTAEVLWFLSRAETSPLPSLPMYNLHRRQLLVLPYVGLPPFTAPYSPAAPLIPNALNLNAAIRTGISCSTPEDVFECYDISMRVASRTPLNITMIPNTLGDLTKRENRFHRERNANGNPVFPSRFLGAETAFLGAPYLGTSSKAPRYRLGEDIILTNVIGFDVRVYDPHAPLKANSGTLVGPSDPGYSSEKAVAIPGATGAYVDLNWGQNAVPSGFIASAPPNTPWFQGLGSFVQQTNPPPLNTPASATYDTWSTHYEWNSTGTDEIDNNADNVIDDALENEFGPPYPVRLRGIEIRIRCYEPISKQIRQVSIRHSFPNR